MELSIEPGFLSTKLKGKYPYKSIDGDLMEELQYTDNKTFAQFVKMARDEMLAYQQAITLFSCAIKQTTLGTKNGGISLRVEDDRLVNMDDRDLSVMESRFAMAMSRFCKYISIQRKTRRVNNPRDFKLNYTRVICGPPLLNFIRLGVKYKEFGNFSKSDLLYDGLVVKRTVQDLLYATTNRELLDHHQQSGETIEKCTEKMDELKDDEAEFSKYTQDHNRKFRWPSRAMREAFNGKIPALYDLDKDGNKIPNTKKRSVFGVISNYSKSFNPEHFDQFELSRIISLSVYTPDDIRDAIQNVEDESVKSSKAQTELVEKWDRLMDEENAERLLSDAEVVAQNKTEFTQTREYKAMKVFYEDFMTEKDKLLPTLEWWCQQHDRTPSRSTTRARRR